MIPSLSSRAQGLDVHQDAWRWTRFTEESGLPSRHVFNVVDDASGVPWAATANGIAWFDGFRWRAAGADVGLPEEPADSLQGDDPAGVAVVIDGQLYRGGADGFWRIRIVDREDGQALEAHTAVGLQKGELLVFATRPGERLGSLFLAESDLPLRPAPLPTIHRGKTLALWRTMAGNVWLNTVDGLFRWDGLTWTEVVGNNTRYLTALAEAPEGAGAAFIAYPPATRGFLRWGPGEQPTFHPEPTLPDVRKLAFLDDRLIIVDAAGDLHLDSGGERVSPGALGAPARGILDISTRPDGNVWLGTNDGLWLYRSTSTRWSRWRYPGADPRNSINEILRARDGRVWLATTSGVLIRDDRGQLEEIESIGRRRLGVVTGLAEDVDGNIWISSGASFAGAYRFDGDEWRYYGAAAGLDAAAVHKIRVDRHGRLWFLGITPDVHRDDLVEPGAYLLQDGEFQKWGRRRGLPSGRVYDFAEDDDGALWFATSAGLSCWKAGAWSHWLNGSDLRGTQVFSLAVAPSGRVWFGDRTQGLGYIDPDGNVGYLTVSDGLVDNRVWSVAVDAQATLWVGTDDGVSVYHDGAWATLGFQQGLLHPAVWPVLPTEDRVYIGTRGGGVEVLNIDRIPRVAPRVEIDPPEYHLVGLVSSGLVELNWRPFAHGGEIPPRDVETRFRIDGGEWSAWSTQHAALVAPGSGSRRLDVQAKGLLGTFDEQGSSLVFTAPRPLLLRPLLLIPAVTLVGIIAALAVTLVVRGRRHAGIIHDRTMRLKALYTSLPLPTYTWNVVDGSFVLARCNSAAERFSGRPVEESSGCRVEELFPGAPEIEQVLAVCADAGAVVRRRVHCVLTAGGNRRVLELHCARVWPDLVNMHLEDVTESEYARAKLERSERRLAEAQRVARIGHWEWSTDNRGWWSDVTFEIFGVEPNSFPVTYERFIERVHPDDRDAVEAVVRNSLASGEPLAIDHRIVLPDGGIRTIHDRAEMVCDENRKPVRLVGTVQDITERKEAERSLARHRSRLQALTRRLVDAQETERRRLARELHDEIGQQLTAMKLNLEAAARSTEQGAADRISSAHSLVGKLIEQVRDLSLDLRPAMLDDFGLAPALHWLLERHVAGPALRVKFEDRTDGTRFPSAVETNAYRIAQEALTNALRYAETDRVEVALRVEGDELVVGVRDHGRGFAGEEASGNGQTGGFTSMRERAASLGGSVVIESSPGRGTSVVAHLPLRGTPIVGGGR